MAARNQSSCTKARPDIHTVKMAMMPLHFIIADPQTSTAWIRLHHGWSSHPTWGETPAFTSHAKGIQGAEDIVFGLGKSILHVLDHDRINFTASLVKVRQNQKGPQKRGATRVAKFATGTPCHQHHFQWKTTDCTNLGWFLGSPNFGVSLRNTSVVQFVNGAFSCQWTCVSSSPSGARVRTWTFSKCASVTILASKHVWERRIHNDPTQTTRFPMAINGFKGRYATRSKPVLWAPVGARIKNSGRYIYI